VTAASGARVFLHIGAPKTGTTYLQSVLRRNRKALAADGVLYPGKRNAHFLASMDLRDSDFAGYRDPAARGAWQAAVRRCHKWRGESVVLSHESFSRARRRDVARAMDSLAPAEVHVVYGARNLTRHIPAVWQERVKNRETMPYRDFLAAIRTPEADESVHHRFWRGHGPTNVLDRWGSAIPPERIHVMTVPPSASDPDALWHRFARILCLHPDMYDRDVGRDNVSLGVVEAEFLRRLNAVVPKSLDWPTYEALVKNYLAELRLARNEAAVRLTTPASEYEWIADRADQVVRVLQERGYDIVGDLDELRVGPPPAQPSPQPDDIKDSDILEMGMSTLFEMLLSEWGTAQPHRMILPDESTPPTLRRLRRLLTRV
jgi:hypothetical protein